MYFSPSWITRGLPVPPRIFPAFGWARPPSRRSAMVAFGFAKIEVVKGVEEIAAKLKRMMLRNGESLLHAQVPVPEARAVDAVAG